MQDKQRADPSPASERKKEFVFESIPRKVAKKVYKENRFFHGTTTLSTSADDSQPCKDNQASLLAFGFSSAHKGEDEVVRIQKIIDNLPKLLEKMADPEAYLKSRMDQMADSIKNLNMSDEEKKIAIAENREIVLKFMDEVRRPDYRNNLLAEAIAEGNKHFFTSQRSRAKRCATRKAREGATNQLAPALLRIILDFENKSRMVVRDESDIYIEGPLDPSHFRSSRQRGGKEAYCKALEAKGYNLPLSHAGEVLDEVGSDLENDFRSSSDRG